MYNPPLVRRYTNAYGQKFIDGYADHGPARIPPLPQYLIINGRDDDVPYLVTLSGVSPSLSMVLSVTLPTTKDISWYHPYNEPATDGYRLYIEGETLLTEEWDDVENQKLYARRGLERTFLQITAPAGVLTYDEISV